MKYFTGRSVVSCFRVVRVCFVGRNKTRRCLALLILLLFVAGLALFSQQSGHIECPVNFTIRADVNLGNRSFEIMQQRFGDLYKCFSSEIKYKYSKPAISSGTARESDFQPVEVNSSSYVYSAYLDDRLAPDVHLKALPVVRIFTALPRKLLHHAKRSWNCVFWYEVVDLPLVMPVAGVMQLDFLDITSRVISAMVFCSLPVTLTSASLIAVSLVSDIREGPQNYLPVTDLRKRRRNFEKLSSNGKDRFFYDENKVSNFTICVPPIFGYSIKTVEVIEFIELNRLLGADKFVFYLESPKQELISCLRYYSKAGLVEINSWRLPFKHEDINYHGQSLAQNDCPFRMMYRTKYVINQDLDEFIVPTRTTDWRSMLDSIHKKKQFGDVDRTASYNFRNLFFRLQEASDSKVKTPFIVKGYELKTLVKTTCMDKLNPWTQRSKVMGRPDRILIWLVHEIYDSSLMRRGDVNALVDEGDGLLFHYRELGPEYYSNTTNRRMWIYQKQLVDNVASRTRTAGCRT